MKDSQTHAGTYAAAFHTVAQFGTDSQHTSRRDTGPDSEHVGRVRRHALAASHTAAQTASLAKGPALTRSPYFVGSPATHTLARRAQAASSASVRSLEENTSAQETKEADASGWRARARNVSGLSHPVSDFLNGPKTSTVKKCTSERCLNSSTIQRCALRRSRGKLRQRACQARKQKACC